MMPTGSLFDSTLSNHGRMLTSATVGNNPAEIDQFMANGEVHRVYAHERALLSSRRNECQPQSKSQDTLGDFVGTAMVKKKTSVWSCNGRCTLLWTKRK